MVLHYTGYHIQGTMLDWFAAVHTQKTKQQAEVANTLDLHT
jgi:hypothetical protein